MTHEEEYEMMKFLHLILNPRIDRFKKHSFYKS
jgi:hypothetical protein